MAEVGEAVLTTVETLSPRGWSFVFTNYLDDASAEDHQWYQRVRRAAEARKSRFVPALLSCETDELCRRVQSPERSGQLKLTDPTTVRQLAMTRRVLVPPEPDVLTIDVTRSAPEGTAKAILDHLPV